LIDSLEKKGVLLVDRVSFAFSETDG